MERIISIRAGEITTVDSLSKGAVIYRAEFPGVGFVEFVVQPGGIFVVGRVTDGTIELNLQDYAPPGVRALGD